MTPVIRYKTPVFSYLKPFAILKGILLIVFVSSTHWTSSQITISRTMSHSMIHKFELFKKIGFYNEKCRVGERSKLICPSNVNIQDKTTASLSLLPIESKTQAADCGSNSNSSSSSTNQSVDDNESDALKKRKIDYVFQSDVPLHNQIIFPH